MANFSTLIAEIEAYIKTNGEQEITGQILQNVLKDIVDTLGNGAVFKGIATTDGTPGTPDNNVFYFAALAGTYTNYGGAVLDGNTLHILGYNGSWTDIDTGVPSATAAATFAKIDGYYASLTAGAAENLVGRGSVPASFLRRTTGGTADVGTGSAKIAKLMGNSIVWNQLCAPIPGTTSFDVDWTANSDGSITANGTATGTSTPGYAYAPKLIDGHKYYISGCPSGGSEFTYRMRFTSGSVSETGEGLIFTSNGLQEKLQPQVLDGTTADNLVFRPQLVDLTLMFGAGKEPSTVAEFKALFSLDYYAYEPGKVLPFAAEKLVTTGFNQWDEEWENGMLDYYTGTVSPSADKIVSKNYIRVFPNTAYYAKTPITDYNRIAYYDANKQYLGGANGGWDDFDAGIHTTPAGAYYAKFCVQVPSYNHDICINLSWSGYRNGEYEPYELHEAIFDPANWEDANGNKIFPYGGMHGVGTARDFATPDNDGFIRKGTRVFGRVDLGSLSWNYGNLFGSGYNVFYATLPEEGKVSSNIICSKYPISIANYIANGTDKAICLYQIGGNKIIFSDSSYNASSLNDGIAPWLADADLYYELAEPVETELAEPVAASYYANDFGTEEWQPANTDEPYTAPCEMLIAYAMNAVDTLRRLPENYISAASFENFCTELATKLGAALNKNITIAATYDAENEEYDYAITIEDIEEG